MFGEVASRSTSDEPKIVDFPGFALNSGLEMHEVLRQRHFLRHGKGPRPSHVPPGSETARRHIEMFSKVEGVLFNGASILIYHPSIYERILE